MKQWQHESLQLAKSTWKLTI